MPGPRRKGSDTPTGGLAGTLPSEPGSQASARPSGASDAVDSSAVTMASGDDGSAVDARAATMATPSLGGSPPAAAAVDDGADTLVDTILNDRYRISRRVGKGGMGAVYEATHTKIGKRVAVKVLLDKYQEREQVVARLEQEARLASSIGHEHIIDITDFGRTDDGRTFVVMEYLEGESLGQLLARTGPLDPPRAVRIARQIASALGAAHEKGIIHRDVKPDNVFLLQRKQGDFVKVVDFGISKALTPGSDGGISPRLTQTGMVLGTPLYMSPEQARGEEELDERIDVYALGVILYEMITGEVPFSGSNYLSVLSQVVGSEPPPPSERTEVSEELEAVILKAMAKDRDERYQTMAELDAELAILDTGVGSTSLGLGRTLAGRARRNRGRLRIVWTVAGVAVIVSAVVVTVSQLMGDREPPVPPAQPQPVVAAAPPPPDAAPPPVREDPQPLEVRIAAVPIQSQPPGAKLYTDGGARYLGVAPYVYRVPRDERSVEILAELPGYDDAVATISPAADDGNRVVIRLQKTRKGRARKRLLRKQPETPSRSPKKKPIDETAGGDLQRNPYDQGK